uniref:Beta-glucuronidase n=1 Tax=Alexandrium monilatum TaxID=311494 RepID=A0A7S4PW02_9DINO
MQRLWGSSAAMLPLWCWSCLLFSAASFQEFPSRAIAELNPWTRTFANGSASQVELPDFFREREEVTYVHLLPPLVRKALVKFTCSLRCELFADGERLAGNDSPHLALVAELPPGTRELRLVVDSRFLGRHSLHQLQYDWWQPGGVFRPVELHALPGRAFLRSVKVYPREFPWVRVEVEASTEGLRIALTFDGREPFGAPPSAEFAVPEPRRWSPASPELHHLTVYLLDGESIEDTLVTRFGLRSVEARDSRVLVNGQPVQLLGVNRHHFGGSGGPIVTAEDILVDVTRIKHLGGNFLRGAHYPQDPRLLDVCDEEGILVWEEALAWQNTMEELTNSTWVGMQRQQIRRMTESSVNHPSVIIYGFLNEGQSAHPGSVPAYQELAAEVRACDPTRLVGWASSVTIRDLAWEFADVVGFNDYNGWYPTTEKATVEGLASVPSVWKYYRDWVDEHYPGKPLIASEFGAGGQAGRRGSALEKWTEEFQSVLLQLHLLGALQADLAGAVVWQLADCPVDPTTDQQYRPNGINDKGLLTANRSPKLAYASVYGVFHGNRSLQVPDADLELFSEHFRRQEG